MDNIQEREMDWEGTITADAEEFILLPEGDYDFTVESFERSRFGGSEKMPPCNQAVLKMRIDTSFGTVYINHNLLLHSKTEWSLSAFFSSIGLKKKGEPLRMNWQLVPGARGRCKVTNKLYKDNQYNEVKKFYPREEVKTGTYTPGQF